MIDERLVLLETLNELMSEYFSNPKADTYCISRETWQFIQRTCNQVDCCEKKTIINLEKLGTVKTVSCNHMYRWTGSMPCTGMYACVFCGKLKDEESFNGKN